MKRALQGVLVAGEKMKEDVLYGRKFITIREGHRDYTEGNVMLGCHLLNWAVLREIVSVRHTTLGEVTVLEYEADGFETKSELLDGLAKFYPDINWESEVTVVRWK